MGPEEKPELKRGGHGASTAAAMVGELWCGQSASEREREGTVRDGAALALDYGGVGRSAARGTR